MISIVIVEDNDSSAKLLENYIRQFEKDENIRFHIDIYKNAINFFTNYRKAYDIIFMDIELPDINGMDAAMKLRSFDKQAVLIFVTNMAKYALKGYEVDALDFMVKPINYRNFSLKLKKAISIVNSNSDIQITISQTTGFVRLSIKDICYIDVLGHKLNYYTNTNIYSRTGSLTELEKELKKHNFFRCNSCYLVNPKHIVSIKGLSIEMSNGDIITISHPRKKQFMKELADWLGQGNFV